QAASLEPRDPDEEQGEDEDEREVGLEDPLAEKPDGGDRKEQRDLEGNPAEDARDLCGEEDEERRREMGIHVEALLGGRGEPAPRKEEEDRRGQEQRRGGGQGELRGEERSGRESAARVEKDVLQIPDRRRRPQEVRRQHLEDDEPRPREPRAPREE